jgi:hypothetical protein
MKLAAVLLACASSALAQEAIERNNYQHQIGATQSFEQAVPRAVVENKVRDYLDQTAALAVYWKTQVTRRCSQRVRQLPSDLQPESVRRQFQWCRRRLRAPLSTQGATQRLG